MLEPPSTSVRAGRLLAFVWAVLLVAALVAGPMAAGVAAADPTPSPSPTETPTPSPTPTPVTVTYRISLLRAGDFSRQYTRYQCVGASLQTMRNMIWSSNNRTKTLQRKLWKVARVNSRYRADGGADPYGWATATTMTGQGRYALIAAPTMAGAVKIAARGIATTGRPAGIVVWHGTHAWVMTGFEATADPRRTDDFRVVTIKMADPLWPYYHSANHRVYRPGMRLYMSSLGKNFTPYHDARLDDRLEGQFVAIVPLASDAVLPSGGWEPSATAAPTAAPTPTPPATPTPEPTPHAPADTDA